MDQVVKVKNIEIGAGIPKICVSMIGQTVQQLKEEAAYLKTLNVDVIEWRVDYFAQADDVEKVLSALSVIRNELADLPLIFTFRSKKEGGEKELDSSLYFALNKAACEAGIADIIDIELFNDEKEIQEIVNYAHSKKVAVIISNHDFEKTPSKEEIIARLCKAQQLGADLPKIAVMPNCAADVITVLDATSTMKEQYADRPIIVMSMAGKGAISRMAGEVFGSALTFAAAKKASAPGQIPVAELRTVLNIVHNAIKL
ncbi:type I 3-dehydroquinate dehydratase [Niallia sp. 01092]|uniref:type I 3-dehydroquinate dehydratase n=1 Tax=unclassified Niallia TaxID=2837522 RepID=UPI003FCFFA37